MAAEAMRVGTEALSEIRKHVQECANNYRDLTRWVISTLVLVMLGLLGFIGEQVFTHIFK